MNTLVFGEKSIVGSSFSSSFLSSLIYPLSDSLTFTGSSCYKDDHPAVLDALGSGLINLECASSPFPPSPPAKLTCCFLSQASSPLPSRLTISSKVALRSSSTITSIVRFLSFSLPSRLPLADFHNPTQTSRSSSLRAGTLTSRSELLFSPSSYKPSPVFSSCLLRASFV